MNAKPLINERTTAYLRIQMIGPDGELALPSAVVYRIDELATGREIRGNTPVPPATTVDITLTPEETRIIGDAYQDQTRLLTVQATYGIDDTLHDEFEFVIRNLRKVPLPT
jgi:hypothetical protein